MLALDLPPDLEERLERLARLTGRSPVSYAREAILEHIEEFEDAYLAAERLGEIHAGKAATVPLAELMKRHGLED